MQDRDVRFKGKYNLFAIYLIPGVTIFLASLDSWTNTSLSVLGNRIGNRLLFAVWGFATDIYYCVYVRYLLHIEKYRNPGGGTLMYTATVLLLMVVMIPYVLEEYPLKADIHVLLASLSPVLLAFSIISFLRFLGSRDRVRFRRAWGILWTMAVCFVLFPLETGFVTSFLEIFIITGLCGYLRYAEQLLTTWKGWER